MKVSQLIELLQKQPPDMLVIVDQYSEYILLTEQGIAQIEVCEVRMDGWVHKARSDKPQTTCLRIG